MNNEIELKDQAARDTIRDILDKNLMVEAGAGSGKTSSLVERIMQLILNDKFKIQEIVAITFTNKAANELKSRFQLELEKQNLNNELSKESKANIIEAIENFDKCYIGTIHSFCSKLLKERPIEAGVSPVFKEIDDKESDELKEKVWHEFLSNKYKNNPEIFNNINKLIQEYAEFNDNANKIKIYKFKDTFKLLTDYPDVSIVNNEPSIANVYDETKLKLEEYNKVFEEKSTKSIELTGELIQEIEKHIKDKLIKDKNFINSFESYNNAKRSDEKLKIFKNLKRNLTTKIEMDKVDNLKELYEEIIQILDEIIQILDEIIKLEDEILSYKDKKYQYMIYTEAINLLKESVIFYNKRLKDECKLGFQELLIKCRNQLRDNPEARLYFSNKYKYLMIDEFQDTDPIQTEIMTYLTGIKEDIHKKNWQDIRIKNGSLFIVGDPKQSIYRFRNADISIYNKVCNKIKQNGEILYLNTNFRSTDEMVNWYNSKFESIIKEKSNYQAKFEKIHSVKQASENTLRGVKKITLAQDRIRNLSREICNIEFVKNMDNLAAIFAAKYIKDCIDNKEKIIIKKDNQFKEEPVRAKDFMILTYGKEEVKLYKDVLEKLGIRTISTGEFKLGINDKINALINLLRYLDDNTNNIAYIGTLRGIFGIKDETIVNAQKSNTLYKIKSNNLNMSNNSENSNEEINKNPLENALIKINEYKKIKYNNTPLAALMKIIEDIRIMPQILADTENQNAFKELYNIIEIIREDTHASSNFSEMINKLEQILQTDVKEITETKVEDIDAVRIMNVHQSKGLEAPIVILGSVKSKEEKKDKEKKKNKTIAISHHISYEDDSAKGYFSIFNKNGEYKKTVFLKPQGWDEILEIEKEHKLQEKIRLQYVAATRASNQLVFLYNPACNEEWIWNEIFDKEDKSIQEIEFHKNNVDKKTNIKEDNESSMTEEEEGVNIPEITKWRDGLDDKLYHFKTPTDYKVKLSKKENNEKVELTLEDEYDEESVTGGAEWGNIIHEVFEQLIKSNPNIEEFMKDRINNSTKYKDKLGELYKEVENFKQHNIYETITKAKQKHSEISFGVKLSDIESLQNYLNENSSKEYSKHINKEVYIKGIIDLIIKVDHSWWIIDYKSDRVTDCEARGKDYKNQLRIYKEVWEYLTGEKVSKTILYFSGKSRTIDISNDINMAKNNKNLSELSLEEFAQILQNANMYTFIKDRCKFNSKSHVVRFIYFIVHNEYLKNKNIKSETYRKYSLIEQDYSNASIGALRNTLIKGFENIDSKEGVSEIIEQKTVAILKSVTTVGELIDEIIKTCKNKKENQIIKDFLLNTKVNEISNDLSVIELATN